MSSTEVRDIHLNAPKHPNFRLIFRFDHSHNFHDQASSLQKIRDFSAMPCLPWYFAE